MGGWQELAKQSPGVDKDMSGDMYLETPFAGLISTGTCKTFKLEVFRKVG